MQITAVEKKLANRISLGIEINFGNELEMVALWFTPTTKITADGGKGGSWVLTKERLVIRDTLSLRLAPEQFQAICEGIEAAKVVPRREQIRTDVGQDRETPEEKTKAAVGAAIKRGLCRPNEPRSVVLAFIEMGRYDLVCSCDVSFCLDKYMKFFPGGKVAHISDKSLLTDEFVAEWLPKHPSLMSEIVRVPTVDVPCNFDYLRWQCTESQEMADYIWRNRVDYIVIRAIAPRFIRKEWIPDMEAHFVPKRLHTKDNIVSLILNGLKTDIPKRLESAEVYRAVMERDDSLENVPTNFITNELVDAWLAGHPLSAFKYLHHLKNFTVEQVQRDLDRHPRINATTITTDAKLDVFEFLVERFPNSTFNWTPERAAYIATTALWERVPEQYMTKRVKSAASAM